MKKCHISAPWGKENTQVYLIMKKCQISAPWGKENTQVYSIMKKCQISAPWGKENTQVYSIMKKCQISAPWGKENTQVYLIMKKMCYSTDLLPQGQRKRQPESSWCLANWTRAGKTKTATSADQPNTPRVQSTRETAGETWSPQRLVLQSQPIGAQRSEWQGAGKRGPVGDGVVCFVNWGTGRWNGAVWSTRAFVLNGGLEDKWLALAD